MLLYGLWLLACAAGLAWIATEPERHVRRLQRDPNAPWNVQIRMQHEALDWHRAQYLSNSNRHT